MYISGDDWNGDDLDVYDDQDLFHSTDIDCFVFSLLIDEKRNVTTKAILAQRWGIGLDTAHKTLKGTTE